MNTFARRFSGVLLALVLLVLPAAAAHGEPLSGALDRWTTSIADLLGDLLDRLAWTGAASATASTPQSIEPDDGTVETVPTVDPTSIDELNTTAEMGPGWDPFGMV